MRERKCCPECGSVMLEPRGSGIQGQSDHDYRCDGCGTRLDEADTETTPQPKDGGINHRSPAKRLEEMDASEVFGDD